MVRCVDAAGVPDVVHRRRPGPFIVAWLVQGIRGRKQHTYAHTESRVYVCRGEVRSCVRT